MALDDTSGVSTIFAAPELRDFKKEATAFVPRGIRQKTQIATGPRVNAAPAGDDAAENGQDEEDAEELKRPDLMAALARAGITGLGPSSAVVAVSGMEKEVVPKTGGNQEQQDEYERFMDDVEGLLN